jgi:hypothetical protein
VDVLGKLRFLCRQGVEVAEKRVRDAVCSAALSVVHDLSAKGVDVLDRAKATLAGDEVVIVSNHAQDDGVEKPLGLEDFGELAEFTFLEYLALAIRCNLDCIYVDEFHLRV